MLFLAGRTLPPERSRKFHLFGITAIPKVYECAGKLELLRHGSNPLLQGADFSGGHFVSGLKWPLQIFAPSGCELAFDGEMALHLPWQQLLDAIDGMFG
jgi:hypothetical protein